MTNPTTIKNIIKKIREFQYINIKQKTVFYGDSDDEIDEDTIIKKINDKYVGGFLVMMIILNMQSLSKVIRTLLNFTMDLRLLKIIYYYHIL